MKAVVIVIIIIIIVMITIIIIPITITIITIKIIIITMTMIIIMIIIIIKRMVKFNIFTIKASVYVCVLPLHVIQLPNFGHREHLISSKLT